MRVKVYYLLLLCLTALTVVLLVRVVGIVHGHRVVDVAGGRGLAISPAACGR